MEFKTRKMKDRFWVVLGGRSVKNPFRHKTKPEAITEAKRLASLFPERNFIVCKPCIEFTTLPNGDERQVKYRF